MSPTTPTSLPSLSKLQDVLNLLAEFRDLSNPFDSPATLKSTLELLADLGTILGINRELLNWLTDIESNTPLLDLILSAGRFLESLIAPPSPTTTPPTSTITIQSLGLTQLLPLIIELVQLLRRLRGNAES
jgi:hypothetical protein